MAKRQRNYSIAVPNLVRGSQNVLYIIGLDVLANPLLKQSVHKGILAQNDSVTDSISVRIERVIQRKLGIKQTTPKSC